MDLFQRKSLWLAMLLCVFSVGARAELGVRDKIGFDLRGLKTNDFGTFGWLAGIRTARFLGKSNVYFGLSAYFGTPTGSNPTEEHVTIGGFTMGYEGPINRNSLYEISLNTGYGQGKVSALDLTEHSYFVLDPGIAAGFRLGEGWKILFATNYLHMTGGPGFSGFSVGFRFEFKTSTQTKAVND